MLILYCFSFALAMLLHELGHLIAARVCRVHARELGLGWGPLLCQFRLGSVRYKLHALPVGAYVRLDMNELQGRPLDQQVVMLLAGIVVNLIAPMRSPASRSYQRSRLVRSTCCATGTTA